MNMSDKKKAELYNAIAKPIMDERIAIQRYGSPQGEVIDGNLLKLQNEIWRRVHKVLNIDGNA